MVDKQHRAALRKFEGRLLENKTSGRREAKGSKWVLGLRERRKG